MIAQLQDRSVANYLAELLDIPDSHYELAKQRYLSLGQWFHRPSSILRDLDPEVYPQGSFRLGTVNRAQSGSFDYDLDLVLVLRRLGDQLSQAELKRMVGEELTAYAKAHSMKNDPKEGSRCWTLVYADKVAFHIDVLPGRPLELARIFGLTNAGAAQRHAQHAIAITDRKHAGFDARGAGWPSSNPRGFALWFDEQISASLREAYARKLVELGVYGSIEDVPMYALRTPLQRAVQILKRHRDVMFRDAPTLRPISMIITTLAAQTSLGEQLNLEDTLSHIINNMPAFVKPAGIRVANPVHPPEDFADAWEQNPRLEKAFWFWHTQVKSDVNHLINGASPSDAERVLKRAFSVPADPSRLSAMFSIREKSMSVSAAPTLIQRPPRPWGA